MVHCPRRASSRCAAPMDLPARPTVRADSSPTFNIAVRGRPAPPAMGERPQRRQIDMGQIDTGVSLKKLDGGSATIPETAVASLRAALRGTAPMRGERGYDEARTLWNGMIDRYPGLVIRALGTSRHSGGGELRPRERAAAGHPRRRAPDRGSRRGRRRAAARSLADAFGPCRPEAKRTALVGRGRAAVGCRRRNPGSTASRSRSASIPPPGSPG